MLLISLIFLYSQHVSNNILSNTFYIALTYFHTKVSNSPLFIFQGYEEFPKLTNEADAASECRDLEDVCIEAVGGARSSPPPPVYTPSAGPIVYPQEPPPAYTMRHHHHGTPIYHHQSQLPMYSLPPYQSSYIPGSASSIDGSAHGHFGVLIDASSSSSSMSSGLPPPIVVTEPPTDYLAPSIFNLLFCCIVFGLFGLVKSIGTRAAIQVGDYELAYIHSMEARNWNIAASVTGGILWALAILALVVVFTV